MKENQKEQELNIVKYPQKVLRERAKEVGEFDESLHQFVLRMIKLMYETKGVGLAAPQVGHSKRVFVASPTGEAGKEMIFINPELVEGEGSVEAEEGCLSVPQVYSKIRRHQKVTIRAQDIYGTFFELKATELLARIVQHETDHLDGKLILDRMSNLAKMSHRRQIKYLEELAKE
jgi:peptide deformylase